MTCPNQLELRQKKLRKISEKDDPAIEGPHSVGVLTLKASKKLIKFLIMKRAIFVIY